MQATHHEVEPVQSGLAFASSVQTNQQPRNPAMQTYHVTKIGMNRGQKRIWMQGNRLTKAGFQPGQQYRIVIAEKGSHIILHKDDSGSRVVSGKDKNDVKQPIIDINNDKLLNIFEGMEMVRIIMREGEIHILPIASQVRQQERIARVKEKLKTGEPLAVGSLSHGGGVLTLAVHTGMDKAGIKTELAFANDIRDDMLEQSSTVNPAWSRNTQYIAAPMQEMAFDSWLMSKLPQLQLLEAGIPCSGASVAGRASRKLDIPEAHPFVGHLAIPFLATVAKTNPLVITLECVPSYINTASMCQIRTTLTDWGYLVHTTELAGADFNAFENRKRMVMVAVTKGMEYDFSMLQYPEKRVGKLSEIMDDVPLDDQSWSTMEGLKAKEIRDKEAGKGFAMQIYDGSESHIGTLTKGLTKNRSTDPKFSHPTNPDLLRIPTPAEHAKAKQIWPILIEGISKTLAHELLGQSVIFDMFVEVARSVGECIKQAYGTKETSITMQAAPGMH